MDLSIPSNSEQQFQELLNGASHPVWITNPSGSCTFLNKKWYEITGQLPNEGEGFGWLKALHPDDIERVRFSFSKVSDIGSFYSTEYRLRMSSGEYRWYLDAATPRFDNSGAFLGYVGNVIDIHARKLEERKIHKSNSRFSAAIEAVAGVMWFTDAKGHFTEAQPGWGSLTGQSFKEYQGNGWAKAIHPDDRKSCLKIWNAALEHKKPYEVEERLRLANGQWRLFSVRAIPVTDAEGSVVEWVGVHTDITERREYEKHVEHLATHDELTGLPNRMLFEDRLNHLIRHRTTKQHAVFFIDLNGFKPINDTLGHQAGNLLLQETARRIVKAVRESDTVARFGGDEFMALLENINSPIDAIKPARKIVSAISDTIFLGTEQINIHASIGICMFPQDGKDASVLVRRADLAMYEAKKIQGGAFKFYEQRLELRQPDMALL